MPNLLYLRIVSHWPSFRSSWISWKWTLQESQSLVGGTLWKGRGDRLESSLRVVRKFSGAIFQLSCTFSFKYVDFYLKRVWKKGPLDSLNYSRLRVVSSLCVTRTTHTLTLQPYYHHRNSSNWTIDEPITSTAITQAQKREREKDQQ